MQLILKAYHSFTHSCALLGLFVSRDAFLTSMKKIAIPSEAVKEPTRHALPLKAINSIKSRIVIRLPLALAAF